MKPVPDPVLRGRVAPLVALPLAVAGSLVAHELAYRVVGGAHAHVLLEESGHGYLEHLPAGAMLGLAVLAVGLVVAAAGRARASRALPAWAVGLVPFAVFAAQEHLERWVHTGEWPWGAALEATFLVGVALQAPFAVVAWALARVLLRTVARLVGCGLPVRRRFGRPRVRGVRAELARSPRAPLAGRGAPRGPPVVSFA
jgi:hypothetical protein